jgi:spoIIIJ-associated protein
MIEIKAKTLEEAYQKASEELGVSIVELDIDVVQIPSSGFLGLFSKDAIIKVYTKGEKREIVKKEQKTEPKTTNSSSKEQNKIKYEIKEGINKLLDASCFNTELTELRVDENEVYIKIDGEDVALMIGKEGYRYKALSYILHNWIKIKYNLNIKLEIADFLKNQEEMIDNYIEGLKEKIESGSRAQTKPLDGILVKIALIKLRELYPDKYVAIKTLKNRRKIIVVQEFRKGTS